MHNLNNSELAKNLLIYIKIWYNTLKIVFAEAIFRIMCGIKIGIIQNDSEEGKRNG